jgi:hypothetical protein
MRRTPLFSVGAVAGAFIVALLATACGGGEQTPADSTAAATPPAPVALTDADFSGTWQGTAMMEGSDSVFAHWTQVCGGGKCAGTSQESPDTVRSTYTIDADSSHGVSDPYAEPSLGGARVVDHWIARVSGGNVTGHAWLVLADKPDSVVMRYRFQGARK